MVDIQTISIAIASASVTVAALYYMWQIRHQTKLRETDLILRVNDKWTSTILQSWQVLKETEFKNYDGYERKHPVETAQVGSFFEDLGLLVWRGLFDVDIIGELFNIEPFWQKLKPWIEERRKINDTPELYCRFEYLYNEWKKRKERC